MSTSVVRGCQRSWKVSHSPASAPAVSSPPSPVHGVSLSQQIRELILQRILSGEYVAGERLVETRIARELEVSQGPVREALRQLEAGGLVKYVPNRGAMVHKATAAEYAEVALVRAVLEAAAAELAAVRGMPTAPLKEQLRRMSAASQRGDLRSWVTAAVRFHRLIVQGSGNAVLLSTWDGLNIEARTIQVVLSPNVEIADHDPAHEAIVDALDRRDPAQAAALSRAHEESFTPVPIDGDPEGAVDHGSRR